MGWQSSRGRNALPVNFLGLILCSAVLSDNKSYTGLGQVSFHGCTSCSLGGKKLVCGFFRLMHCLQHLLAG